MPLVRFGLKALLPATLTARRFRTDSAAALFAGCAAHAFIPLDRPLTSAFGLTLMAAGHRFGWPFARGGSQALADAMISYLKSLGGQVETGRFIRSLAELPRSRVILADISPGPRRPALRPRPEFLRQYRRFRPRRGVQGRLRPHRAGAWLNPDWRAGTLHLGGTAEAIAAAESAAWAGWTSDRYARRPADAVRPHPLRRHPPRWVYAHVHAARPTTSGLSSLIRSWRRDSATSWPGASSPRLTWRR